MTSSLHHREKVLEPEQVKGQISAKIYQKSNVPYWVLRSRWPLDQAVGNLYGIEIKGELPLDFVAGDFKYGFANVSMEQARLICIDAIKEGMIKCYSVPINNSLNEYELPFLFVDRLSFLTWAKSSGAQVPPGYSSVIVNSVQSPKPSCVEISIDSIKALRDDQLEHYIGVLVAEHCGRQHEWDQGFNVTTLKESPLGVGIVEAFDWKTDTLRKKIRQVRPSDKPARRGGTRGR